MKPYGIPRSVCGFSSAIVSENLRGYTAVIPDIKCVSPKEGDLLRGRDPVEIAKQLVRFGAPALSVVTEREHFGGSPELLRAIAESAGAPVLRKDFIDSMDMLKETVELGAASVLLICSVTNERNLAELYEKSLELNLEPLVEVCTADEMRFAGRMGARLIGVNNRDILTMELDDGGPERTAGLAAFAPEGALIISESGISSPEDVRLAVSAGANATLVGTALWHADDMEALYKSLRIVQAASAKQ